MGKMGKSLKNGVSPDEMYDTYGADTLRLYLMATGPMDASRPWETRDVIGMYRFAQRLWRNIVDEQTGACIVVDAPLDDDTRKLMHRTIDVVRTEMDALRFNTAIAKLIELNNAVTKLGATPREVAEVLTLMVSPLAPHLGEELWRKLGHDDTVTYVDFPVADAQFLVDETIEYPVQVNGKVRSHIVVPTDADPGAVEAAALADDKVIANLDGAAPKKVIVIPGRMINIVV
jgi:leucyl-tRNA synthetase